MKKMPIYLLLALAISSRFLDHPANFTALGAIALFSGLYLDRKQAFVLPIAAMFISDLFIGFYNPAIMTSVYLGFVLMVAIGKYLKNNIKVKTVLGGTVTGSMIFFLLTNAAVWAFGTMYTHDLSGLFTSYYYGLPFLRNELLGSLFYSGVLVGGYEMIRKLSREQIAERT